LVLLADRDRFRYIARSFGLAFCQFQVGRMNGAASQAQVRQSMAAQVASWALRHRVATAYLIAVLSWAPLLACLDSRGEQGDIRIYKADSGALLEGRMPYRDTVVEYPPYAIPIFVLPRASGSEGYLGWFMMLAALCDIGIRGELLLAGVRRHSESLGFLLPTVCYCAAIPFLRFFLFQRFDLWPALVTVSALLFFSSGRLAWSGLFLAIGVGMKVYPAVLVPPLFILSLREGKARRFVVGLVAGVLPMFLLSFFVPWWRFAQFQGDRGLQCESLAASLIWAAKHAGLADAQWAWVTRWFEVKGPLAVTMQPWARVVFIVAVMTSATVACLAALRIRKASLGLLARLVLMPLVAFVAFNQVLSPQFMIWLLPLAALATLEGNAWTVLGIPLATMLTPIIFPSLTGNYGKGLNPLETSVLVARNCMLVVVWALLFAEQWRLWRNAPELKVRQIDFRIG
jgi:hypothetical protein